MPQLYPDSGLDRTIDQELKQPEVISQDLLNLVVQRLIADRIFTRGTASQVAGGVADYGYDPAPMFADRDPEEVGVRSDFPRTGITPVARRQEIVRQYGLETEFNNLTIRRSRIDEYDRALRLLANSIVRFLDTKAMAVFTANTDIPTAPAAAVWTADSADIIADVATALEEIDSAERGYAGDTMLAHTSHRTNIITNDDFRRANEGLGSMVLTGNIPSFLGLERIIFSQRVPINDVYILNSGVVGTIADEVPEADEGYSAYQPPDNSTFAPIWTMVYENNNRTGRVLRAARWPAIFLTDPEAVFKITGVTTP